MKHLSKIFAVTLLSLTVTSPSVHGQTANRTTTKPQTHIAQQNTQNSPVDRYFQEADRLFKAEKFREAIAVIDKAIAIQPNNKDAYYFRGVCYQLLKQYQQAKMDFTKVIEVDPTYSYAYLTRGVSNYFLRENNSAIKDFQTAADLFTKAGDTKMAETALRLMKQAQQG